jgi:hypothetical protein
MAESSRPKRRRGPAMTPNEWEGIVKRINAFWKPVMTGMEIGAYFEILKEFDADEIHEAVNELARAERGKHATFRPAIGELWQAANNGRMQAAERVAAEHSGDRDPLPTGSHGAVMAELRKRHTQEQARRFEAVMALLREYGRRLTLAQLQWLLPEQGHVTGGGSATAAQFDARITEIRKHEELLRDVRESGVSW